MPVYWNNACTFVSRIPIPAERPVRDVSGLGVQQANAIADLVNYPALIPVFIQEGINNALAVLGHPELLGDEAIIYDPRLLRCVFRQYGMAAPISTLAHEVGHLVTGTQVPGWIAD